MTTFDTREQAFEQRQAYEDEIAFKAVARRNKLLGEWAADRLGLSGAEAEAYARNLVDIDFKPAGYARLIEKVQGDLRGKGIEMSDHRLMLKLAELLIEAKRQVTA